MIVRALAPTVLYVPAIWLQSAVPLKVPSVLNVIVYFAWSAAGMTPRNAGVFSVIAVSCQFLPVRALVSPPLQAASDRRRADGESEKGESSHAESPNIGRSYSHLESDADRRSRPEAWRRVGPGTSSGSGEIAISSHRDEPLGSGSYSSDLGVTAGSGRPVDRARLDEQELGTVVAGAD